MANEKMFNKYRARLSYMPAPGGNGCHPALLGIANCGLRAGLSPEHIFADLRESIPNGTRTVPDREITAAIDRALADLHATATWPRRSASRQIQVRKAKNLLRDPQKVLRGILAQATIKDEAGLSEVSPVKIGGSPAEDAAILLTALFAPTDLVFVAERESPGILGRTIRPAADVITALQKGLSPPPFIICNPLNGLPMAKESGDGKTLRGDANVEVFRYCIGESDEMPREDQIRFWSAVNLPVRALVDSGGKSVHAWIDLRRLAEVNSREQWNTVVKELLYRQVLVPMGIDSACSNPSRLTRMPGHYRTKTNKYQRLLWLSIEGRKVIA